ncbi:MAG: trypsin-like peptidase domain-containing protein [Candidatus Bathyarchaeia archaeon]
MSDEYSTRNRDNMIWVIVVVMMVLNVGVLTYSTIYGDDIDSSALATEVETLRFQLNSAIQEIETLQEEVRISGLPDDTPNLGFIEIYNTTRNSVVLIETDIGSGSGWVYDTDGHIITNNHVVEDTSWIQVTFQSGTIIQATLVGRDPYSDMAVIRINHLGEPLLPLEIGVSKNLLVGETVIAIGNPFGLDNTMTAGIVSATGRQMSTINNYAIVDVIQTDAAINPGNSGGPLFNLRGKVVGMNTAIISNTNDFSGIGFAIPSDTIQREVMSLIEHGSYEHPWLGVSGLDLAPQFADAMGLVNTTKGTLVVNLIEGGPADLSGILGSTDTVNIGGFTYSVGGDVIIGIDGVIMETFYELQVYLTRNTKPGDTVTMNVIRDGEVIEVPFTLGSRPPPS